MFSNIHLSIGVFLHCNVVLLNCFINCHCIVMFTHVCSVSFNKVSVVVVAVYNNVTAQSPTITANTQHSYCYIIFQNTNLSALRELR